MRNVIAASLLFLMPTVSYSAAEWTGHETIDRYHTHKFSDYLYVYFKTPNTTNPNFCSNATAMVLELLDNPPNSVDQTKEDIMITQIMTATANGSPIKLFISGSECSVENFPVIIGVSASGN